MLKRKIQPLKSKNKKGMALLEAIPVLTLMVVVLNFSIGFFGAVHSGILNSIGAYNYAIETFRFRSDLMYFRPGVDNKNYKRAMARVHGVVKDGSEESPNESKGVWPATVRDVMVNYQRGNAKRSIAEADANESEYNYGGRGSNNNRWTANSTYVPQEGSTIQTPRIWVKTVYGICINADCSIDGQKDRVGE
ncbi:MAG: hypothetical protein K0R29_1961 [Pseudobdellovibrio sp.]|jgi:hypothetical protein|nr:hypothetical protein [Pseudobdellovibrio sp.]